MFSKRTMMIALCVGLIALGITTAQAAEKTGRRGGKGGKGGGGPVALTTKQVRGPLYQVSGGVSNSFFYVGADEVLVIDAEMTPQAAKAMLEEVKKVSDKPVKRLVLTHSDGDHVGGLPGLPQGIELIAQENAKKEIEEANANAATKLPLPAKTFDKGLSLKVGDKEVDLLYYGPAHTSGDTVVFFPADKVAVCGDLIFVGRDPLIHEPKHGTSFGVVRAQEAMLKLDADLYLSGHAEGIGKQELEGLKKQIEEKQAKVKELKAQGKSLDEVKKAMGVEESAGGRRWPSLVEVIYHEVSAQK